jgi:hypothetical protein
MNRFTARARRTTSSLAAPLLVPRRATAPLVPHPRGGKKHGGFAEPSLFRFESKFSENRSLFRPGAAEVRPGTGFFVPPIPGYRVLPHRFRHSHLRLTSRYRWRAAASNLKRHRYHNSFDPDTLLMVCIELPRRPDEHSDDGHTSSAAHPLIGAFHHSAPRSSTP